MQNDNRLDSLLAHLENPAHRDEAIKSLGMMKATEAVEPLCRILLNRQEDHGLAYLSRKYAAEALGNIGDTRAVTRLTYALEDDHSASVQISAAFALGQLNHADALPALEHALQARNIEVQIAAVQVMGRMSASHDVPVAAMIDLLADHDDPVRDATTGVLREMGAKAVDALIEALKDTNSTLRGAAANLLGEIKDERAREPLREIVYDDESRWVRSRAEWALAQLPKLDAFSSTVDREGNVKPSPIVSALERVRSQVQPPPPRSAGNSTTELDAITPERIQTMLDSLDVRLANGEISEETYRKLVKRWQDRLEGKA